MSLELNIRLNKFRFAWKKSFSKQTQLACKKDDFFSRKLNFPLFEGYLLYEIYNSTYIY